MNFQQMIDAVNRRVDDIVDTDDAIEWLNSGKDQMAMSVQAKFPDIDPTNLAASFPFDSKYHEGPVLYASARFKEQDSSVGEAANFMTQFEALRREFTKNYAVPPRYRDDNLTQQFTAVAGQLTFTITKENYSPSYGDLRVYVNDLLSDRVLGDGNQFTLLTPCAAGDAVTAIWEEHTDLIDPPYNWWRW